MIFYSNCFTGQVECRFGNAAEWKLLKMENISLKLDKSYKLMIFWNKNFAKCSTGRVE